MRRLIYFLFSILFFLFFSAFAGQHDVALSDSSVFYSCKTTPQLSSTFLNSYCKKNKLPSKKIALQNLFDSLGYFNCTFLLKSRDTVFVDPGTRSSVTSLHIFGTTAITLDSISKMKFPRFYDAGEISAIAKQSLFILGTRGYPFASLSITMDKQIQNNLLTINFTIKDNGRYFFANPLFSGKFKTNRQILLHDILFRAGQYVDLRKVDESKKRLLLRPYIAAIDVLPPVVLLDSDIQPDSQKSKGSSTSFGYLPERVLFPIFCEDREGLGFDGALTFQAGGQSAASNFYGFANISLLNSLHSGESADISYKGQKDFNKLEVALSKPYLFNTPLFTTLDFGLEIKKDSYGYLHGGLEESTEFLSSWQLGIAMTAHETLDSGGTSSTYAGLDIILNKQQDLLRAGLFSKNIEIRTGNGLAQNNGRQFNRWHVDISGFSQIPLTQHHALTIKVVGKSLFTDAQDTLQSVELYRTGGFRSIRGYTDDEFSFKTVGYCQGEYLYYFRSDGALYGFLDAGAGFSSTASFGTQNYTKLLGFGVGIRIPVKIGQASIEWARNYKETKGLGRIHVSIQNPISASIKK